MGLLEDLKNKINAYATEPYEIEATTIIPDTDNPKLTYGNKGLTCEYTFLFVDIRKSSKLHETYGYQKAAKIYQSFHEINVRIIKSNNGEVRAFDGDRIMAVFAGEGKNSAAAKTALQIKWGIENILNPTLSTKIYFGAGIDTGKILVTKIGKGRNKNTNDLVWIGKADNYASHLANEASGSAIISAEVYNKLNTQSKLSGDKNMWSSKSLKLKNGTIVNCYESTYSWEFD